VQVFFAVVNVAEAVDLLPGQMRGGRAQVLVFGVCGVIHRQPNGVDGRHLQFIIAGDLLPVYIDISPHLPQPFDVLLFRPHVSFLLSEFGSSQKPLQKGMNRSSEKSLYRQGRCGFFGLIFLEHPIVYQS
jgi:hypothetical protein